MALRGGNSRQTAKAARTGDGRARTAETKKAATTRQEQLGARYTQQKHSCAEEGCESPCPLAHPTA